MMGEKIKIFGFNHKSWFLNGRKAVCALFSLIVLCLFLFPAYVNANNESGQTVRIGYYENEVFEEGASPDAVKTGYAYEYYRKLSEYTGWNYEYVYGSFSELYDMLLSGEVDLLAGLAFREDRAGIIGYPSAPMGNEVYTLVKHDDDASVTFSPESVQGKRIGVLKSAIVDILEKYLENNSVEAKIVLFDDYESLFAAFDSKDVDILAAEGDGAYGRDHAEVICSFGTSDYYLCVSKSRQDLLLQLDEAQSMLSTDEPNFIGSLQNKYYSSSVSSHTFSLAEREWLSDNKKLVIGYLNNYMPYSTTDKDGNLNGILKEIIPAMLGEMDITGIDVSYVGYDNYDAMIQDICDEKIDAGFPVGGGLYYTEENGIYQSAAVVSSSTELVFKDEYNSDNTLTFAVNENNRMQYYYIRTNFPDAGIAFYPDIEACLNAVLKGEADATTLNGLRANEILKNSKYKGLSSNQLSSADDRCFGVKIGNEGLLKLLNRGIKVLGSKFAGEIAYKYSGDLYTYTFMDRIHDNLWLILSLCLVIVLLVLALIVRDLIHSQQANRMKTDFVSNMSHEIRTPITAILGMNEMIQMESNDMSVLRYAENIEKAGESLLGIINDILDFSKIEAGRMELDEQPYSLPEFISNLQLLIMTRAEEKDLKLTVEVDEKLPRKPIGDVQKLRQVITNLLTNAVKYTKEGEISFKVKLKDMSSEKFTMEIAVEDTGIGIKEEEMNKLFSAFDRLDMERTRNIEGSGLGLAISQRLLSLMGSEIKAESEYGKGSVFSFSVQQKISDATPIGHFEASYTQQDEPRRNKRAASFKAPEAKILIVDDTPMNLQVVCGLLKGNEMNIETVQSGKDCIERFGDNSYDMVFLDQRMPVMDGVETLRRIHELYPEKSAATPIICLTANVLAGGKEQMLQNGFTDYLTKPVSLYEMEKMLLKYLPEAKVHMISKEEDQEPLENAAAGEMPDDSGYELIPVSIQQIAGLDIESGIDYCGDEEEYLEALRIFEASVKEKSAKIRAMLENSDIDGISLTAHSIKSTSRSVGAKEFSALAENIEKTVKTDDAIKREEKVLHFLNEYESLGKQICDAINGSHQE